MSLDAVAAVFFDLSDQTVHLFYITPEHLNSPAILTNQQMLVASERGYKSLAS